MENDNLKEFVLRIFDEREKQLKVALDAQAKALELATHNMEIRLHNLNEWRQSTIKEREQYATIDALEPLKMSISNLEKLHAANTGAMKVLLPLAAVFGGLVGAVASHLIK